MFPQETRALNDLRIAGWIRSLPLPVQYSSTHVAGLFAYAALAVAFSSGSEMQRRTNTEPGAVATGYSVDYEPRCFVRTRALDGLCIAGWVRSLRALDGLCIAGWVRSLSLPVQYSSTHVAGLFAYAALAVAFSSGSEMQRCTNTEPTGCKYRPISNVRTQEGRLVRATCVNGCIFFRDHTPPNLLRPEGATYYVEAWSAITL